MYEIKKKNQKLKWDVDSGWSSVPRVGPAITYAMPSSISSASTQSTTTSNCNLGTTYTK